MANISGLLIKDSFDYVIQVDPTTRHVLRIGGVAPNNPIFTLGLTAENNFTYTDGNQQNGYVLTTDALGNATWNNIIYNSFLSGFITGGTYNSSTGVLTLNTVSGSPSMISGFVSSAHTHIINNIVGLQSALDSKSSTGHSHHFSALTTTGHTHVTSEIIGLDSALQDRSLTSHTHSFSALTNSDITGLDSALQDRSLTGHTHQGLLPTGGTSNQVLTKVDGVDFNTTWTIPTPINYPYIEVNRVIFVSQIGTGLTPNVFYKISKVYENVNNYFIVQVDSNQQPSPVGYIHLVQDPSGNTIDFKGFVEYSPVLDRLKYDVFDCLLSQTAEDPPTMNIQSNSFYIDSSFLEYNDKGNYSIRVNQGVDITDNTKVGVYLEQKFGQIDWGNEWIVCSTKLINGSDMVYIYVLDIVAGYLSDGWLDQTPFKITIKNY